MHFLGLKDDLLTAHRNPGNEAWRENCRAKTTTERGEASVVWEQELDRQETIVSRATIHRSLVHSLFIFPLLSYFLEVSSLPLPKSEFSFDFDYRIFSRNYIVDMDINRRSPLFLGTSLSLPFVGANPRPRCNRRSVPRPPAFSTSIVPQHAAAVSSA